jgi:type I restriction enzyme S subunit
MSFPRYPKYKDSGVEWLGEVPEGWEINEGKRVFCCRRQIALESDQQLAASQKFGVIPQSLMMELNDSKVMLALKGTEAFRHVVENDFVISLRSFEGGLEHSKYTGCVSPAYTVLNASKPIESGFFRYLFKGVAYVSALQSTTDSLRDGKSINYQQFGAIPIPLPTLPEQQTIATFLDRETAKIDALVAEQENLIALLKEKRQAVISHAVTKGLDPTVPMKDSGIEWLGEVPDGWLVTKFGRVAFMQEGPGLRNWQFVEDGIRVICVTNITENGIDFSRLEKFISPEEYVSSYQHFTVENGDILLSSSGNSWGKVAVYDFDEAVILNTSTIRLNQLPDKQLDREYIKLLLQSLLAREQLSLAMTGSCQPNFGPTHLNSLSVLIPTREEQQAIIGFVNGETAKLDTLTAEAQRAIDLLKERRSALISATVTGKIDVRGYRAQPPPII